MAKRTEAYDRFLQEFHEAALYAHMNEKYEAELQHASRLYERAAKAEAKLNVYHRTLVCFGPTVPYMTREAGPVELPEQTTMDRLITTVIGLRDFVREGILMNWFPPEKLQEANFLTGMVPHDEKPKPRFPIVGGGD